MADLSHIEKSLFEKLFGMSSGYVLKFSDRTFAEFIADVVGLHILDDQYAVNGTSKANRMRTFWKIEPNHVVGKVLAELVGLIDDDPTDQALTSLKAKCSQTVARLLGGVLVDDIAALNISSEERAFHLLAASVRDSIDKGEPEAALDRLHTYVTKYMRQICKARRIPTPESKPLHAVVGEYAKLLAATGVIQSRIAEQILKNSIGVMESFNYVRNRQSLAHDNELLERAESLLIVNHVVSTVRFIQAIEESR